MREPFGRAAARRRGRRHAAPRPAMRGRRPAVRHARAAASTTRAARAPPPPPYSPLAHNCSGKHAGMLAYCVLCGWPRDGYLDSGASAAAARSARRWRDSPACADDALVAGDRRLLGAQLRDAARRPGAGVRALRRRPRTTPIYGGAPRRLADAMTAHPEMVSGERRSDLALMRAGRGDWIAKIGAEGVQAIGVRSAGPRHRDQGGRRQQRGACIPVAVAVLDAARARSTPSAARALAPWAAPVLHNCRGMADGAAASRGCPGQGRRRPLTGPMPGGAGDELNAALRRSVDGKRVPRRNRVACGRAADRNPPDAAPAVRRA